MSVPLSQMWTVASYVLRNKLRGEERYPLVLMLEPLLRCNLACAGCGKIQHPAEILRRQLTPEQCFRATDECGAPIVSIPGGEPLLHPQIDEIVAGLVAREEVRLSVHQRHQAGRIAGVSSSRRSIFRSRSTWTARAKSTIWPFAARVFTTLRCRPRGQRCRPASA